MRVAAVDPLVSVLDEKRDRSCTKGLVEINSEVLTEQRDRVLI
jgi:hypothetical protein